MGKPTRVDDNKTNPVLLCLMNPVYQFMLGITLKSLHIKTHIFARGLEHLNNVIKGGRTIDLGFPCP